MWPLLCLLILTLCLAEAITGRRRRERLRESMHRTHRNLVAEFDEERVKNRAQQQVLFDSMVEGLLLADPEGRIILANKAMENLFESGRDLRGLTLLEAFRSPELHGLARRLETEEQIWGYELSLPGLNSKLVQVNASAVKSYEAKPGTRIFVFHDLTRLKELENTRQEFVANVSHELRTPISLIKGYAETLLDGAKDNPEVSTRFLKTIERQADRLTFLIEDLLTISRIESGQVALNIQDFELRSLVERLIDELAGRAIERKVTMTNEVPPDWEVQADSDRILQVLNNLIVNAIKYGRVGGKIIISATIQDSHVTVSVADDGPGIERQALGRVFERFYRVDQARARHEGGTGLGLSIVKHIIQSHGGEVHAVSEVGKGSVFSFTLKCAPECALVHSCGTA